MGDRGFLPMHDTGVHTTCDLFDIGLDTVLSDYVRKSALETFAYLCGRYRHAALMAG